MRNVLRRGGLIAAISAAFAALLSPVAAAAVVIEPCGIVDCQCVLEEFAPITPGVPPPVCYPDPCPTLSENELWSCDVSLDGLLADPTNAYPDCDIDAFEPYADDGIMYAQASYSCDRKVPDITLTVCLEHAAGPPVGICKTKTRALASSTGQVYDKEPCVPGAYRTWAIATWGEKAVTRDLNEQEMHAPAFPFFVLITNCDYTATLFDPMELVESPVDVEVEREEAATSSDADASASEPAPSDEPSNEAPAQTPEEEPATEPEEEAAPEDDTGSAEGEPAEEQPAEESGEGSAEEGSTEEEPSSEGEP